jgi:hypothetical protein
MGTSVALSIICALRWTPRQRKKLPTRSWPTPSGRWPWTRSRRPSPGTPACPWAWPRSRWRSGGATCATTRPIPPGRTGTGSWSRTAMARCSCTACCTSPATRFRSRSSSASASSARRLRDIRSTAMRRASRRPPGRSDRASPMPWAWRSRRSSSVPSSTARASSWSTTILTSSWATAA